MQLVLPSIIDQAQSALLRGRSIIDNVLLMQDLEDTIGTLALLGVQLRLTL